MFDRFLLNDATGRRLHINWSKSIPGLVRAPLFSPEIDRGFVVSYLEKSREYELISFHPENGDIDWSCNLVNGGYGSLAVSHNVVAVPTKFVDVTGVDAHKGEILWTWKGYARVRSPIAVTEDGCFLFSCGSTIIVVNAEGKEKLRIEENGSFFYGLVHQIKTSSGNIYISHLTWTNSKGRSQVGVAAFYDSGKIKWRIDLGEAQIISSDTSGTILSNDTLYCAAGRRVAAVDPFTGYLLWCVETDTLVGRQMPTVAKDRLFVPSISGHLYCLDINNGEEIWRFIADTIINTPVSILGDLAIVSVDGQVHMLLMENGNPFDKIATGHSPYSAITFYNGRAFLGGGDPPYHGRLYAFDLADRLALPQYVCRTEATGARDDRTDFTLQVEITNAPRSITDIYLDSSVLSEEITNGSQGKINEYERYGNHFVFSVPIRNTIVSGQYCIDLEIHLNDGSLISRTALVEIKPTNNLPKRVLLHDITPISQISPWHSGAAVVDMVKRYYGQKPVDQEAFRQLVDNIREASGYEPFNLWRIVTRRALSTAADRFEDLPEVKNGNIKVNTDGVE
ncbi:MULTISPECIES: PQQ-like beta-propeller repeat protein [unclassified Pannonibacter]|uniref:PQQ-like beta-propeller repeat protein n=1 Tax=unclassified Pannonibacter TaxID=2627228 RepID=UPI001644B0C9|nr:MULTISPECIES: PQQ-like beta-propeller repeat protein [unclassified Pannonibacter]